MKKLFALGLAAFLTGCGVQNKNIHYSPTNSYENNNISLEEGVIQKVSESVVKIEVSADYMCNGEKLKQGGVGTGTVINRSRGKDQILTAEHVITMPETIDGLFISCEKVSDTEIVVDGLYNAKVSSQNEGLDYALLEIPMNPKLKPLKANIGDSNNLQVGDYIYAIGYSLGLEKFVSDGMVTNTSFPRGDKVTNEGFMFSSSISPGNSGGPLFAVSEGELYLVGIAHAYYPRGQQLYIGKKITPILKDIKKKGVKVKKVSSDIEYFNKLEK